jgi:hypothetical protein
MQESANQGGLAIIDAAGGREAQQATIQVLIEELLKLGSCIFWLDCNCRHD